jgi:hypothetical protein
MTLPAPGNSISANQINVEATRSGTANAPLSGTSATPQAGSLVKIYENSGVNQVAPHKYSEFYSKSYEGDNIDCGGVFSYYGGNGGGYYTANINLGSSTGAVVIYFSPEGVLDGTGFLYNSTLYNTLTFDGTPGALLAATNTLNFVGINNTSGCGNSNLQSNSPYTLDNYVWNGSAFVQASGTTDVVTTSTNLQGSSGFVFTLVVPKTSTSINTGQLQIASPCTYTDFYVKLLCPATLPSFTSSTVQTNEFRACQQSLNQTYYFARNGSLVNGAIVVDTNSEPEEDNFVFSDDTGSTPLANGFYKLGSNDVIKVQNGVIIIFYEDVCF